MAMKLKMDTIRSSLLRTTSYSGVILRMPIISYSRSLPISTLELQRLWVATREVLSVPEQRITVACITEEKIRTLNRDYRKKDRPTNVLTFSYGDWQKNIQAPKAPLSSEGEHDVILCLSVAEKEAVSRSVSLHDYVALLLVHSFLHVCGMDHERSHKEEQTTAELEQQILTRAGFPSLSLS